ncbi:MAG: hypothetical protein IKX69_00655, partial [Prevotella sp.]|nr:hypothetical protein [Prevotella sp.]
CPLDELTVTGLDDCVIKYAPGDGDGFSDEPVFTQVLQGLNMFKIVGTVTADKRIVVTSPSAMEDGTKTKIGFQVASYTMSVADAIETVDAQKVPVEDGKIYNLAGQQVNSAKKGIYIKNGKKFVIK